MESMAKQMELFADGGLMDEGGMVDEVSGNEVPPGSTREEVRDDIPAQLSEGEFVFPADVVRYFGLEKLMEMRQEAKMGLKRMDDMGQMGNSDEATMPDDLPFTIDDLDIEEEDEYNEVQEFAVGGAVQMPGFTGIGGYVQPPAVTTGVAPAPVAAASAPASVYQPPQQQIVPTLNVPQTMPTFQGVVGFGPEGVEYETVTYVNEAGQTLVFKKNKQTGQLLDMNGNPATVPEGYKLKGAEDAVQSTTDTSTVTGQSDGGDRDSDLGTTSAGTATVGSISEALKGIGQSIGDLFGNDKTPKGRSVGDIFASAAETTDAFGGSKQFGFSNEELRSASFNQGMAQMGSFGFSGIAMAVAKQAGMSDYDFKDLSMAGATGMNNALNAMGLTNRTQLMNNSQAALVGQAMAAGHKAAKAGQDPQKAIDKVLNNEEALAVQRAALESIKNGYAEKIGAKGSYSYADMKKDMEKEQANALKTLNEIETGSVTDVSGKKTGTKVMSRDMKTGLFTKPTNAYTKQGLALKNETKAKQQQAAVLAEKVGKIADYEQARQKGFADKVARQQEENKKQQERIASGQYSDNDRSNNDGRSGGDDSSNESGSGGGMGGGYGSESDGYGGGDYKGAFVGETYKKNKLAKQMKQSGLASKK